MVEMISYRIELWRKEIKLLKVFCVEKKGHEVKELEEYRVAF